MDKTPIETNFTSAQMHPNPRWDFYTKRSDRLASEFVLSLDHVMDEIFSFLDINQVLTCRLVSSRFSSFGSTQIRKRITLHFESDVIDGRRLYGKKYRRNADIKSLEDFMKSLRRDQIRLLVSKFIFSYDKDFWRKTGFHDFLNVYGNNIQELTLHSHSLPCEASVLNAVQNILERQTPNIHYLKLDFEFYHRPEHFDCFCRLNSPRQIRKGQGNLQKNSTSNSSWYNAKPKNKSLKIFEFGSQFPSAKVLDQVIELAPNLVEVIPYKPDVTGYRMFLDPVNRMYLLKTLKFNPWNINVKLLEKISFVSQQRIMQLTKITIQCCDRFNIAIMKNHSAFDRDYQYDVNLELDCVRRIANVINRLLEWNRNSLDEIVWEEATFLRGFKWPECFPNVRKLVLSNPIEFSSQPLFHHGFTWSTTFPKLKRIQLNPALTNSVIQSRSEKDAYVKFVRDVNFEPWPGSRVTVVYCWGQPATTTISGGNTNASNCFLNAIRQFFRRLT